MWIYKHWENRQTQPKLRNWIDEGDYVDGHRAFFPENEKLFTYRKLENDEIIKQSRIDYSLASMDLQPDKKGGDGTSTSVNQ